MEDCHVCVDNLNGDPEQGIFCLFDGHGGAEAINYCKKQFVQHFLSEMQELNGNAYKAFESCFSKIDQQLLNEGAIFSGTTATIIYIRKEGDKKVIYSANIGDSKAYLITASEAIKLTYDDIPNNPEEFERILSQGGYFIRNRVAGQLAITRSLGDHRLKGKGLIAIPHIIKKEVSLTDKMIIIASDGL